MKPSEKLAEVVEVDAELAEFVNSNFRLKAERKTSEVRFHAVEGFELGNAKVPNQAKFLLQAIGEEPVTYVEWGAKAVSLGMGTRQDPARIAAYYAPELTKLGAVVKA